MGGFTRRGGSLRAAWADFGLGGRLALAALIGSAIVAVALGFAIPRAARQHLLDGRSSALRSVAIALAANGPAVAPFDDATARAFDDAVREVLIGGETVGAKVWSGDGVVLYATDGDLIGQSFALPMGAVDAFAGRSSQTIVEGSVHPDLNVEGRVIEFFFPVDLGGSGPETVFEIEQLGDGLEEELRRITRTVWASIGIALGLLVALLSSVALAAAHAAERRRVDVERSLRQALLAQEVERKRIVSALHGDVGQRLYRVLYGIEGLRGADATAAAAEIDRLEDLVRSIDRSLRSELKMLHRDSVQEIGFSAALRALAETTRLESGLSVVVDDALHPPPAREIGGMLLWAAEEAIINVRKHAGATEIVIRARYQGDRAVLEVADDGLGPHTIKLGIGLLTLKERLGLVDGGIELQSRRGAGTTLVAWARNDRMDQ